MDKVIEEIRAYRVSDGTIFADERKAAKAQREIDFTINYEDSPLHSEDGPVILTTVVLEWMDDNKQCILDYLKDEL